MAIPRRDEPARFAVSDEKEIIMSKKDLKYFMRPTEPEIITAPGPESFKDSEGKTIDFEIKVLTTDTSGAPWRPTKREIPL